MLNDRLDVLTGSAFISLDALISEIAPAPGIEPINFSIGDPQHAYPEFVLEKILENRVLLGRYSPTGGTPEFRQAAGDWLTRRYGLPEGMIEPDRHLIPVAGLREAMFMIAITVVPERKAGQRPAVLIPDPFYHCYAGAAAGSGAEAVFVPARREGGFMPDYAGLDAATLARTAAAYICSPANPQGAAASLDYLASLVELARAHDFVLLVDECYAEIYTREAPPGALEACLRLGGDMRNVVVFHSLSKRSSVPGLRSGFAAGDADIIRHYLNVRNYGGMAVPRPMLAASTALWRDEAHVERSRALYTENFDAAERILGNRFGFYRPDGGMFLWLEVGDSEAAARRLWAEQAVKVMPGLYMSRDREPATSPGGPYIRVALVHDLETTKEGLSRLAEVL
jgi:aspartate/methionine/tyrosine aminotransferase